MDIPQFDRGTTADGSLIRWFLGSILSNSAARLFIAIVVVGLLFITIATAPFSIDRAWDLIGVTEFTTRERWSPYLNGLYVFGILIIFLAPLGILAFSKPVGDVLVSAARAALAAGTGVAPWVGAAPEDHIIRLDPGNLKTAEFSPSKEDQEVAINDAQLRTLYYIDSALEEAQHPVDYTNEVEFRARLRTEWSSVELSMPQAEIGRVYLSSPSPCSSPSP